MAGGFASQAEGAAPTPGGGFASQVAEPTAVPAIAPAGKTVNVISPDGKVYGLDAAYLPQAAQQGYQVETAEHAGIRSYIEQNKGLGGAAKVALQGLLNEGTFGVAGAIAEGTGNPENWSPAARVALGIGTLGLSETYRHAYGGVTGDPYKLAKFRALQDEHKVAGAIGSVGGFGLSMLYGGELFQGANVAGKAARTGILAERALAKGIASEAAYRVGAEAAGEVAGHAPGIARQILAHAADYGVQGAFFSAPKAAAQLLTGDPDKAAETFIWGVAGGAALGGIVGAGSGLLGRMGGGAAAKMLPSAAGEAESGLMGKARAWAEGTADKQAFRSIASNEASLGKVIKDLELQFGDDAADKVGRYMRDNGLIKEFGASARDEAKRFAKNVSDEGRRVGNFWKTTGERFGDEATLDAGELSTKIREKALRPLYEENFGMEGLAESLGKKLDSFDRMATSKAKDGKISLEVAHDLQRQFDKHIKFSALNTAEQETINTVMADARRALNGELMAKVKAVGGDAAYAEIKDANERFAIAKSIAKGAKDYTKREGKNRVGSPTDYLGALAGVFMGGSPIVGTAMGLAAGYAHHVVRTEGNALAARALGGVAEGRGLAALEGAFAKHGTELATIPSVLDRMSKGGGKAARETAGVNILSRFLDAHDAKLDDQAGLMKFADNLASLSSNPEKMQAKIEEDVAPLNGEAPEVATAIAAKLPQVAAYLSQAAPKSPYAMPTPFVPAMRWKPTDAQVKDYRTKVTVALNPYAALDALANGTLTKAHVDALQAVAPKLYQEMLGRIADYGGSGKAPALPYAQRLKLSMMTGAPLDRSIAQLAGMQSIYGTADAAKVEGGGKPIGKGNAALQQTDIARISG